MLGYHTYGRQTFLPGLLHLSVPRRSDGHIEFGYLPQFDHSPMNSSRQSNANIRWRLFEFDSRDSYSCCLVGLTHEGQERLQPFGRHPAAKPAQGQRGPHGGVLGPPDEEPGDRHQPLTRPEGLSLGSAHLVGRLPLPSSISYERDRIAHRVTFRFTRESRDYSKEAWVHPKEV